MPDICQNSLNQHLAMRQSNHIIAVSDVLSPSLLMNKWAVTQATGQKKNPAAEAAGLLDNS